MATTSPEVRETPAGESLSKFLAKSPRLCRQGEVRPLTRLACEVPGTGGPARTPSRGDWVEVLAWLQAEPDATGKALMARLQAGHPDGFSKDSCGPYSAE